MCGTFSILLRPAPDHSNPDPGIEVERRSIILGGLYCGNCASGSFGLRNAFLAYLGLHSNPKRDFSHFACSYWVSGRTKILLRWVLLSCRNRLFIFDLRLLAIVEANKYYKEFKVKYVILYLTTCNDEWRKKFSHIFCTNFKSSKSWEREPMESFGRPSTNILKIL